ncbi:MAG: hypothetical protein WBA41_10560 [Rivularia sp. (in: cyanobacteria)]
MSQPYFLTTTVTGFSSNTHRISASVYCPTHVLDANAAIKSFNFTNDQHRETKFMQVGIDNINIHGFTVDFEVTMSFQGQGNDEHLIDGSVDVFIMAIID